MNQKNRKYVILVRDENQDVIALQNILDDKFVVEEAKNARDFLERILMTNDKPDLVIFNTRCERNQGAQLLGILKSKDIFKEVPVILYKDNFSTEQELDYYDMGIVDLLSKPLEEQKVNEILNNALLVLGKNESDQGVDTQEQSGMDNENVRLFEDNVYSMLGTIIQYSKICHSDKIETLKEMVDYFAHQVSAEYQEYELSENDIHNIVKAACIKDIGMLLIPDKVKLKSGVLNAEEREVIKSHTTKGMEIVKVITKYQSEEMQKVCYEVCRFHHERYDGSGYPEGLKDVQLPISAQIVSVIDCFFSLLEDKVYRKAYSFSKAVQMIEEGECGMFSSQMIRCFDKEKDRLYEIYKSRG